MSPFREASAPIPRAPERVSDDVLVRRFETDRVFFLMHKDAYNFEDAQRRALDLIKSVDPEAEATLRVKPSAAMQEKLDRLNRLREQQGAMVVDSCFGNSERIQGEWEAYLEAIPREERTSFDQMEPSDQMRRFVAARRDAPRTLLRWLGA